MSAKLVPSHTVTGFPIHLSDRIAVIGLDLEGDPLSDENMQLMLDQLSASYYEGIAVLQDQGYKPTEVQSAWQSVYNERHAQTEQWGGAETDDTRAPEDWIAYMGKQADRMRVELDRAIPRPEGADVVRSGFVKIAALAIAALESHDRTYRNG